MSWRLNRLRWQFLPGVLAALVLGLLVYVRALQPLEQLTYTKLFQVRGEQPWDERVVVVAIDDASLQQLGRFPWPRQRYAELLDVLTKQNANIVAFDMLWSEPSPDDARLAEAMMQQGKVVLAQAWDNNGFPLLPTPELQNAAIATGHLHKREDLDGIVRSVQSKIYGTPTLSVTVIQTYSLVSAVVPLPDPQHSLQVNWLKRGRHIPSYSFVDVLQGKVPAEALRDKIVLVGVTALGLDPLVTPYDRNPPTYGIYLHATLINNLLQQNLLRPLSPYWLLPIFVLGGPCLSWFLYRHRTNTQLLLGVGCLAIWGVVSLTLFKLNYWVPTATAMTLFGATTGTVILYERLRINQVLQQQIQQLWQTHHADLVIRRTDDLGVMMHSLLHQPISMQRVAQLAALAEQFGRSQSAQAVIARNLSVGLIAADLSGLVWFCNPAIKKYLRVDVGDFLQPKLVPEWLGETEWNEILQTLQQEGQSATKELCLGDRWFDLKFEPLFYRQSSAMSAASSQNLGGLLLLLEDTTKKKQDVIAQAQLNQQLTERTVQLELVNKELETFSYAVSHDLRAPLRRIDGFSHILLQNNADQLDDLSKDYMNRIRGSAKRMGELIEDLLNLSRLTRVEMHRVQVDLSSMVEAIANNLQQTQPERDAEFIIAPNLTVNADERLLKTALENLLDNAWKYTSKRPHTQIEFGAIEPSQAQMFENISNVASQTIYFIRDNGAGFDMAYVNKLFRAFQRLHTDDDFSGTGVGLMTTQRIIHRHNGRIWAEGAVDQGATFYFTL